MDHSILRVLAAEVHRRACPGCGRSLRDADISARFATNERVQISFRCQSCSFEGGGEIALTVEIREEASMGRLEGSPARKTVAADPISADEVLAVHEMLERWEGRFQDLLEPQPELLPPA